MSIKIFTNLFCRNLKHAKHLHLYPPQRLADKSPFFTGFGDAGKSKIRNGEIYKDHLIFEAIGVTEELNAHIGLAREYIKDIEQLTPLAEKLRMIQLVLVDVMDIVSNLQPNGSSVDKSRPPTPVSTAKISNSDVADLETLIAHYGTLLPPVEKIVIPSNATVGKPRNPYKRSLVGIKLVGSGKACAALHVARSICRRCERILVAAFKDMDYEKNLLAFINRLSTYLLQAARISAKFANKAEVIYKPHVKGDGTISDK